MYAISGIYSRNRCVADVAYTCSCFQTECCCVHAVDDGLLRLCSVLAKCHPQVDHQQDCAASCPGESLSV